MSNVLATTKFSKVLLLAEDPPADRLMLAGSAPPVNMPTMPLSETPPKVELLVTFAP